MGSLKGQTKSCTKTNKKIAKEPQTWPFWGYDSEIAKLLCLASDLASKATSNVYKIFIVTRSRAN